LTPRASTRIFEQQPLSFGEFISLGVLRANAAWIERRDPAELQRLLIRLFASLGADPEK
jgi:hypothetical protein